MAERTLLQIGAETQAEDKTIDVDLVGVRYTIYPPKSSFSMRLARLAPDFMGMTEKAIRKDSKKAMAAMSSMNDLMEDWIHSAFSKTDAKKVLARLDDPTDRLDVDHIFELLQGVMEHVSGGRPTT